ncbi:MAG: hypothetical protein EHV01_005980 [Spiroplasma sp. hy2]|uniref:hypothetical protein n=1 Tax=Spiroplasma sp. hy2 TaxID=2490850 RepID=UPI00383EAC1E
MTITELIKYDKLQEENEVLKKEITELKQQQLYKKDFVVSSYCINCGDKLFIIDNLKKIKKRKVNKTDKCNTCGLDRIIKLKDNSLYDKLPSKDVK